MRVKKEIKILLAIFIITLAFRLFFSLQTPNYIDDDSYFILRQVSHVTETGKPILNDPLSYGGRNFVETPLYYYVLSFFNLFLPISIVGKVITSIFASCLVFVVYLLAKELTRNEEAALFTAFISGFIPIFLKITLNSVSTLSFFMPLLFLTIYFFIRASKDKKYAIFFLLLFIGLSLTSSLSFLFAVATLFYIVLSWLEKFSITKAEIEIALGSALFLVWSQFIIYKKVFLLEGTGIIWGNIPVAIISQYFSQFNLWEAIINIGIIPFVCGIYIIYKYVFKIKNKEVLFFASFALSTFILLWFRMIQINIGLTMLGIVLIILFSHYYKSFFEYVEKTKISQHKNIVFYAVIILFVLTSVLPSIGVARSSIGQAYTDTEISAFAWLSKNTPADATIAATYDEGNLVTFIAKRKNFIDSNFLFASDVDQRLNDIRQLYTSIIETDAISLLNKYNVTYIVLSDRARAQYGIKDIKYVKDVNCFDLAYNNRTRIYQSFCKTGEVRIEIK